MISETLFWLSGSLILYTYVVYPAVIFLLGTLRHRTLVSRTTEFLPTISVMISVYNEERVLPEKLANISAIDYPADRIEFLFGSDGATDATNAILSRSGNPSIRLYPFSNRRGKAAVLNELVSHATGEILVFTDANTLYRPDTIRRLVQQFSQSDVGGVCGELVLSPDNSMTGGVGERSYWSYENLLKQRESDFQTIFGATGGVYAIRKNLFVPLPLAKSVTDDLLVPLEVVRQGYRMVYDSEALAFERSACDVRAEFRRKVRIGAQNFNSIAVFHSLLLPRKRFVAFGLWSHKMIRWCVPFLGLVVISTSIALSFDNPFYRGVIGFELLFLVIATLGYVFESRKMDVGILTLPFYLVAMNIALFVGFLKAIAGKQTTTWEVVR